jgi:hypothetical protein
MCPCQKQAKDWSGKSQENDIGVLSRKTAMKKGDFSWEKSPFCGYEQLLLKKYPDQFGV